MPSMLARLTMLPPPRCTMPRTTVRATCHVPLRLMSSTRAHSTSSMVSAVPKLETPAAFTSTSIGPTSATTPSIATSTATGSRTSAVANARHECESGTTMSSPATRAPSSANRRAHAAPIPDAAPVTNATLPANRSPTGGPLCNVHVRRLLAPAVHQHLRATDVARERRREEQTHVGHVGGVGHPSERHGLADGTDAFLVAVEEVRLLGHDQSDHHRVHTHLRCELDRERLRGIEQAGLGGAVRHRVGR